MGGFARPLGEIAEKLAPKIAEETEPVAKNVEAFFTKTFLSDKTAFENISPHAAKLYELGESKYNVTKGRVETAAVQAAGAGKPMRNSKGLPLIDPKAITRHAHEQAYKETYGPNGFIIQAVVDNVKKTQGVHKANELTDLLHIKFKQEQPSLDKVRMQEATRLASGDLKKPAKVADTRTPLQRDLESDNSKMSEPYNQVEPFAAPKSNYKARADWEKYAQAGQRVLAYKASIIHAATTPLNIMFSHGASGLFDTIKTFSGPGRAWAEAQILVTNSISNLWMDTYREQWAFQNGRIKKFLPGSAGEWLSRNLPIPGLAAVRRESILWGAQAGRKQAEIAAAKMAKGDFKFALPALAELRIDPGKLAANKFKLSPEDIEAAYYHGANNTVFLDPSDSLPAFWRQSPYLRQMKAFGGFVAKQGVFYKTVFKRQLMQGDYVGIARNIASMALLYPVIGSTITEMEKLMVGQDWDNPLKHYKNRLDATAAGQAYYAMMNKQDPANAAKTIMNTFDMQMKMAAFGGTAGYLRGANRANLLESISPPVARMTGQVIQDTWKALKYDSKHKQAAAPLGRDILEDAGAFLGVGEIAAHQLLPTKRKPKGGKYRPPKAKTRSNNPLTYEGVPSEY